MWYCWRREKRQLWVRQVFQYWKQEGMYRCSNWIVCRLALLSIHGIICLLILLSINGRGRLQISFKSSHDELKVAHVVSSFRNDTCSKWHLVIAGMSSAPAPLLSASRRILIKQLAVVAPQRFPLLFTCSAAQTRENNDDLLQ